MSQRDLEHFKGTTLRLRGSVRRERRARMLVQNNDTLVFGISEKPSLSPILRKTSGLGIDMDDNGNYIVTVSAEELSRLKFPREKYSYAVRITEGDTAERYPIIYGDLYFKDLPV